MITRVSPPTEYSVVAITGEAILITLYASAFRLPAFWYLSSGVTRVVATSLAGCWNVCAVPVIAFTRYRCHSSRFPESHTKSIVSVHKAAAVSDKSIRCFLFILSVSVPTGSEKRIYGTYDDTVRSAVLSAEPVLP